MGKSVFSRLLMGLALLATTTVVVVTAGDEDGVHPLRTHSIYMPYIGKTAAESLFYMRARGNNT
jgi:mannose-binding lectin 2